MLKHDAVWRPGKREARRDLEIGVLEPEDSPLALSIIHSISFVVILIFNEIYLLNSSELPASKRSFAIGQWGPWVGVALTRIAAAIVKYKEIDFLKRQEILAQEKEILELRMRGRSTASQHPQPASAMITTDPAFTPIVESPAPVHSTGIRDRLTVSRKPFDVEATGGQPLIPLTSWPTS